MNITVYCGSSAGNNPVLPEQAKVLGRLMAKEKITLVYGGSSLGIMGAIADSVMLHSGEVIGVIPENLFAKEVAHKDITRLLVIKTMHERKHHMAELGDAFIALPGGYGTFEELFEIITWNQLKIIEKPVILLNSDGYYDKLISFLNDAFTKGFIRPENKKILFVAESPEQAIEYAKNNAARKRNPGE